MSRVALADVLWDAANRYLSDTELLGDYSYNRQFEFSCNAVSKASGQRKRPGESFPLPVAIRGFLCSLGCDTHSAMTLEDTTSGVERQGVRYMWLLLAMHVAEDEGIVIERGAA